MYHMRVYAKGGERLVNYPDGTKMREIITKRAVDAFFVQSCREVMQSRLRFILQGLDYAGFDFYAKEFFIELQISDDRYGITYHFNNPDILARNIRNFSGGESGVEVRENSIKFGRINPTLFSLIAMLIKYVPEMNERILTREEVIRFILTKTIPSISINSYKFFTAFFVYNKWDKSGWYIGLYPTSGPADFQKLNFFRNVNNLKKFFEEYADILDMKFLNTYCQDTLEFLKYYLPKKGGENV